MTDLQHKIDELLCLYSAVKEEIRRTDKSLYERWKAGGFLVDDDIVSMYPALAEVSDSLPEDEDEDEDEETTIMDFPLDLPKLSDIIDEHDERNNLKE